MNFGWMDFRPKRWPKNIPGSNILFHSFFARRSFRWSGQVKDTVHAILSYLYTCMLTLWASLLNRVYFGRVRMAARKASLSEAKAKNNELCKLTNCFRGASQEASHTKAPSTLSIVSSLACPCQSQLKPLFMYLWYLR
jgi:hypothetical protein